MKKIISTMLTVAMLAMAVPVMADSSSDDDKMALLAELDIMVGDDDGNLRLDDKVSRAEFSKIAVSASRSKNMVASGLNISPFKDVPYTHWSAPYVRAAVSAGIAEGYIDATFKPDDTVSYEEALTMLLKVLGYTNDDFGYSWPHGQIGLAENLDITDDVDAVQGEQLTRRQVATLVYNTLNTKMKDSQSNLVSIFDCNVIENATIISTEKEDSSLGKDKVFTSSGEYTKGEYLNDEKVGLEGTMFIKNSKLVAFVPDDGYSKGYEKYVVYSMLPNAVVGYNNGSFETIDIPDSATVYKNHNATTYSNVKNGFEMGDILYVKRTNGGSVDYVTHEEGSFEGPICVKNSDWMSSFGADSSTTVMRSGNRVSASEIQVNDVVYYSSDLNMILAYTDKVTGVYEKATPTKDSPTSVTVSGKQYSVESVEAFNALSSSGNCKYGDTVTLLLGRTGEVAGVVGGSATNTATSTSAGKSGFVIETGKKDFTNADNSVYSSYYAKIVTPDGNVNEYATDGNYSSLVCSAVRISFKNGKASLTISRPGSGVSGKVNASRGKIGDSDIADDIRILDTSGTYSDDTAGYCKIYPQRIDGVTLSSSNILYYSKNGTGEIDELILKDVTGDTYTYGVITKRDKNTGAYTIDIDGTQNTYMTGFSSTATGPHRFKMENGGIESMQQLVPYPTSISELTRTEARIGSQRYLLSDKVVVYRVTNVSTYMKIPIDDAINGNYRMTAYYDKLQTSGGRIRIIIAQDK